MPYDPKEMEDWVVGFRAILNLPDPVTSEALIEAIESRFHAKICFIDDIALFSRGDRSGIYPVHYQDASNLELNVDISEESYEGEKDEAGILEKIKVYRTIYTLGILLFHTRKHTEDGQIDWKDTNYDIRDIYLQASSSLSLNWFLTTTGAGLFASCFLMPETKIKKFIEDYRLIERGDEQGKALREMATFCSVPYKILLIRLAYFGLS